MSWDLALLHAVNGLAGRWYALDLLAGFAQDVNLLKGAPFVAALIWFWWRPAAPGLVHRRRAVIVNLVPAVFLALVVNRAIAVSLPFRDRPFYDLALGLHKPLPGLGVDFDLENWTSFPSDTATFFLAMATGLWLCSRRAGLGFGLYALLYICGSRIYFGIHYPSDIAAGAVIGILVMLAVDRLLGDFPLRLLSPLAERHGEWFWALAFLAGFELASIFENVRRLQHGLLVGAVRQLHAWMQSLPLAVGAAILAGVLAIVCAALAWGIFRYRRDRLSAAAARLMPATAETASSSRDLPRTRR